MIVTVSHLERPDPAYGVVDFWQSWTWYSAECDPLESARHLGMLKSEGTICRLHHWGTVGQEGLTTIDYVAASEDRAISNALENGYKLIDSARLVLTTGAVSSWGSLDESTTRDLHHIWNNRERFRLPPQETLADELRAIEASLR